MGALLVLAACSWLMGTKEKMQGHHIQCVQSGYAEVDTSKMNKGASFQRAGGGSLRNTGVDSKSSVPQG